MPHAGRVLEGGPTDREAGPGARRADHGGAGPAAGDVGAEVTEPASPANKSASMLFSKIGPFTVVPNSFLDASASMSMHAFRLFVILLRHADNTTGVTFPGYDTLRLECNVGANKTIANAIRELAEAGWIERRKRFGASTIYTLKFPSPSRHDGMDEPPVRHAMTDIPSRHDGHSVMGRRVTRPNELASKKKTQRESAPAPAIPPAVDVPAEQTPKPTRKTATRDARALAIYGAVYGQSALAILPPVSKEAIVGAVADDDAAAARWEAACREWATAGNRPGNVAGILDWFNGRRKFAQPAARAPGAGSVSRNGKSWRRAQVPDATPVEREQKRLAAAERVRARAGDPARRGWLEERITKAQANIEHGKGDAGYWQSLIAKAAAELQEMQL